jgi:hypothetical protein
MKNEEVIQRVKGERNIQRTIKRKNPRNGLLTHVIEGKVERAGRWEEDVSSYRVILRKREGTLN